MLLVIEVDGRLDAGRLRQRLVELARYCPALNGRLATSLWRRHACWRLDAPREALAAAVHEREDLPPGPATAAWLEERLMTPMDLVAGPPVQFHILHRAGGDMLVMQWPHALMDGRGMLLMIQALGNGGGERFAGDEARTDYFDVLERRPAAGSAPWPDAAAGQTVTLAGDAAPGATPRLRAVLHHLGPGETERVAAHARSLTGAWPSGRYIRACAIQAVHEHAPFAADGVYRIHALVDCRPDPNAAVCWNLSAPLLLSVPRGMAHDRRLVSDELHRQMRQHNAADSARRQLRRLSWFAALPTSVAARLLQPTVRLYRAPGGRSLLPATSLAADLLPPLDPPLGQFLGAGVVSYYHIPTIPPRPGLALFVTFTGQRLNTTGVCCEPTVPRALAERVVGRFVELLLTPVA